MEEERRRASVVITGANSGLGYACAKSLMRGDWGDSIQWHVVMACRDETRAKEAIKKIQSEEKSKLKGTAEYFHCDLASLASVRDFASNLVKALKDQSIPPLKALVLNAGLLLVDIHYTEDG